jgi:hypothetical protein
MLFSPLLPIHIGGGTLGILFGTAALSRAVRSVCERKYGVPVIKCQSRGLVAGGMLLGLNADGFIDKTYLHDKLIPVILELAGRES